MDMMEAHLSNITVTKGRGTPQPGLNQCNAATLLERPVVATFFDGGGPAP